MKASLANGMPHGYEVGYRYFTINGRMLGHGEPVSVKQGERILFHVLNGSATEIRSLALPGHSFKVIALDGNAVPTSAEVPALWLGTAERISAIVDMNHPGVWILGDRSAAFQRLVGKKKSVQNPAPNGTQPGSPRTVEGRSPQGRVRDSNLGNLRPATPASAQFLS